jgi:CRP/FNR family cyclic AMP-dependent transcriptional regulator
MPRLEHLNAADALAQATLSPSLRTLTARGELRRVRKGVRIISEGDAGDTLFVVLAGRLRIFGVGDEDREITYGVYDSGEYVGEMSLDGGVRSANVETLTPCLLSVIRRSELDAHLSEDPAFAFELLAKVIRRARMATLSLKQIALNDVYGRLRSLLDSISQPQEDGSRLAEPAPSHLEMSQTLGCSREMVSRLMKDLERGQYIEASRRRVRLLRPLPARW